MFLHLRGNRNGLPRQDRAEPFGRPGALGWIVQASERLERDQRVVGQASAEVVPVAAHGQRRGADRSAEVEGEHLRAGKSVLLALMALQFRRYAGAGRPDDERVADVAHVQGKPERCRRLGLAGEQRRAAEMVVPFRARPDRRQRDHVGEVEGRDRRLADVGVGVAGQRSQPGLHGVDRLGHAGEVAALNGLLDQPELGAGRGGVLVPDRHRRRDKGLADHVRAQVLQGGVRVERLVVRVGIQERGGLVGHHLLQDGGDGLALGEPLTADLRDQLGRVGLVEADRAGRPAVGKGQPVQLVEQPRPGRGRKARDGQDPQMGRAEARLEPAGQRLVGEQHVQVHRRLGDPDPVPIGRDRRVQVGQGLGVGEPGRFRDEALDQRQDAIGAVDEAAQDLAPVHLPVAPSLVEPLLGACGLLGRRQVEEGEEIAALEVRARFLELRPALLVDQLGDRVGKPARRVGLGRVALGLHEKRPAGAQTTEGVVQARRRRDQLGRRRRVQVRPAKPRRPLE